jgi:hypothetical protein
MSETRLHRLVTRACRHSYGADAALRAAVRRASVEMIEAGATREAVRDAITRCVQDHPSGVPNKSSLVTGQSVTDSVLERMLQWTDDALDESRVQGAL